MTEIKLINGRYFLQTIDKYDNPMRPGTDGYRARQKIVEIGRQYRAPENLESFAPNYFDDAYGKRVE